jgi:crotonobetainyl-CoA:carnitine CoA-transferase CaiB-like acyl-CoA transferase
VTPSDPSTTLAGLRILEIGDYASAPACGAVLAHLGADVIKLEPPRHGDSARTLGPFLDGIPDLDHGTAFRYLNARKLSVTLDLTTPSALPLLAKLLTHMDVVVDNVTHEPRFAGRYPDHAMLAANKRLVRAHLSSFGLSGPRAGWTAHDLSLSAASGLSNTLGLTHREPLALPVMSAGINCGLYAAAAVLVAVLGGAHLEAGESIEISEEEALLASHTASDLLGWALARGRPRRDGSRQTSDSFMHENAPCRDGMAHLSMVIPEQRRNLARVIAERAPSLVPLLDPDDIDAMAVVVKRWLPTMGQDELLKLELAHNIGVLPVLEPARFHELLDTPWSAASVLPDPRAVTARVPSLGEDNAAVWGELVGVGTDELAALFETGVI